MKAVILAGGKGSRLGSITEEIPKGLCPVGGRPLMDYVLENLGAFAPQDIVIVVKYLKEKIMQRYAGCGFTFVDQVEMLGTGHAVGVTETVLRDYRGPVLTAFCDMPLLDRKTVDALMAAHKGSGADCTVLTASVTPTPKYGRIIRNAQGEYVDIVEEAECTPEEKLIPEVHVGMDIFQHDGQLYDRLRTIAPAEHKKEIYLTKLPTIYAQQGKKVHLHVTPDNDVIWGVNDSADRAKVEQLLRNKGR